jgi:hypothetical protein
MVGGCARTAETEGVEVLAQRVDEAPVAQVNESDVVISADSVTDETPAEADPSPPDAAGEEAGQGAATDEADGVCPPPGPGLEIEAWLSALSDEPVTEGLETADMFVGSNTFYFEVPEDGGEGGGLLQAFYMEGTSIHSVFAAFGPSIPGVELTFDPNSRELGGEVRINTSVDGGAQVTDLGAVHGTLQPDGTVTGSIEHPDLDLSFDGRWVEGDFAYTADPDCLGPEYEGAG